MTLLHKRFQFDMNYVTQPDLTGLLMLTVLWLESACVMWADLSA